MSLTGHHSLTTRFAGAPIANTGSGRTDALAKTVDVEFGPYDIPFSAAGSLAAAPLDLDLTALATPGGTLNALHVLEITVVNEDDPTAGHDLTLNPASTTNPFAGLFAGPVTVKPGGTFSITAPGTAPPATSAASKILRLDPGANTVPYFIHIKASTT